MSGWVERIINSENTWVEIESDGLALSPYTSLLLRFYDGEEVVKEIETLFKCDMLGECEFCWTNDLSSLILTTGRQKKTLRTKYKNLLLWNSSPVLEDRFYSLVKVYSSFFIAVKEHAVFLKNFRDLLIEERQGLYRLLPDNELPMAIFTQSLELVEPTLSTGLSTTAIKPF